MINNTELRQLVDESKYTHEHLAIKIEVHKSTIIAWTKIKNPTQPNNQNTEKVTDLMKDLRKPENKRLPKHPSYGYAKPQQIERLSEIGICPERDEIMKQIEKQNKAQGKIK